MKKIILCFAIIFGLAACSHPTYPKIEKGTPFLASVNIQEPSIQFFDKRKEVMATWSLKEAYTGAVLVGDDRIFLYGHGLDHGDLVQLSTGEHVGKIKTATGISNALYDEQTKSLFLANSTQNTVISYDINGRKKAEVATGNYPMAMLVYNAHLFVVNFKDTQLMVFGTDSLRKEATWTIPKSSTGIEVIDDTLWLGGHGDGSTPNDTVLQLNPSTGKIVGNIQLPMMPIAFLAKGDDVYVLSHGESMLYTLSKKGHIRAKQEIAANPFTFTQFQNDIVVAGYDDQQLYWTDGQKIIQKKKVDQGPFQLLVRE